MPNYFTGNIDKWLLLSESETDFAILFVRCWIPFNAWYCNNYGNTHDRSCIDKIKADGNQFRARIVALLGGSDYESKSFRAYVGQVHDLLERYPIPDASSGARISFSNIYFRENPLSTVPPKSRRNLEYKTERLSDGSFRAVVVTKTAPGVTKYFYSNPKYDLEHFKADLASSSLNMEQKAFLTDCFKQIDPKRKENLIIDKKKNALEIGGFYFLNDCDLISKALVEVLYGIRCKLFHGELQPSKDNLRVYEPAYHIIRILLNSLR
ncbi:MAG: hypothetical protein KA938_06750 [Fervidobacterium sp.]|nr:hypothetical protein [Fervidobacterium sp.]